MENYRPGYSDRHKHQFPIPSGHGTRYDLPQNRPHQHDVAQPQATLTRLTGTTGTTTTITLPPPPPNRLSTTSHYINAGYLHHGFNGSYPTNASTACQTGPVAYQQKPLPRIAATLEATQSDRRFVNEHVKHGNRLASSPVTTTATTTASSNRRPPFFPLNPSIAHVPNVAIANNQIPATSSAWGIHGNSGVNGIGVPVAQAIHLPRREPIRSPNSASLVRHIHGPVNTPSRPANSSHTLSATQATTNNSGSTSNPIARPYRQGIGRKLSSNHLPTSHQYQYQYHHYYYRQCNSNIANVHPSSHLYPDDLALEISNPRTSTSTSTASTTATTPIPPLTAARISDRITPSIPLVVTSTVHSNGLKQKNNTSGDSHAHRDVSSFALPRYLSPQTRDMCALLERHGKTVNDLAIGIPLLPGSDGNASLCLTPRYIPTTPSDSYLSQQKLKRSRLYTPSYSPYDAYSHQSRYYQRIRAQPSLWLRIGALVMAIIAAPLYFTAFHTLQHDEYMLLLNIRTTSLAYATAVAFASLGISVGALPVYLWSIRYYWIYCSLTIADSVMLIFWLIASFLTLNPIGDTNNPQWLACSPHQALSRYSANINVDDVDYLSTCARIKAGTAFAFLSVIVYIFLLGGSLLRVRHCRLHIHNNNNNKKY